MRKSTSGFTIVELLIVIVVIAILATISIVAYNGIQDRAYNAKVIAGTQAYNKAFLNFKSVNGVYSLTGGCLGANYPNNACWAGNADGTSAQRAVSSSLDTALKEFIPTKPEVGTDLINIVVAGSYRAGLVYIPNDATYGYRLTYYLKGNVDCGLPVANRTIEGPLTQCNISLPN